MLASRGARPGVLEREGWCYLHLCVLSAQGRTGTGQQRGRGAGRQPRGGSGVGTGWTPLLPLPPPPRNLPAAGLSPWCLFPPTTPSCLTVTQVDVRAHALGGLICFIEFPDSQINTIIMSRRDRIPLQVFWQTELILTPWWFPLTASNSLLSLTTREYLTQREPA